MTKNERAEQIKGILLAELFPEIEGKLFIEVTAQSKDSLLVELLNQRGPGKQIFISINIIKPDAVKTLFEALSEAGASVPQASTRAERASDPDPSDGNAR